VYGVDVQAVKLDLELEPTARYDHQNRIDPK
jgi:hypothetical protein